VEGPTVLKDRSGYYMLYSAPDAESPNYQVGYATARHPLGPWRKRGILIPTLPCVPGPGHQGVVLAPDNLTPYLLYHRKRLPERGWNRDLMLDRLWMRDGRMATRAPTMIPQPAPPRPAFEEPFKRSDWQRFWEAAGGAWRVNTRVSELTQTDTQGTARVNLRRVRLHSGIVEVNVRRLRSEGGVGLTLVSASHSLPILLFPQGEPALTVGSVRFEPATDRLAPLAYHQLLLIRRGRMVEVRLNGGRIGEATFDAGPASLELVTQRSAAAFSGIAVTNYVDPLPLPPLVSSTYGWHRVGDRIEQRALGLTVQRYPTARALASEGRLSLQVQGWSLGTSLGVRKYGVHLESADGRQRLEAYIDPPNGVLATHGLVVGRELPWQNSDLPLGFDYTSPHTLKVSRRGARWQFSVDGRSTQTRQAAMRGPVRLVLVTEDSRVTFSDIRVSGNRKGQVKH
jgi:hypothetical protein